MITGAYLIAVALVGVGLVGNYACGRTRRLTLSILFDQIALAGILIACLYGRAA